MNTAYVVLTIERELGWGAKPDGYLVFLNEDSAMKYIHDKTKDRDPYNVPVYYIQYDPIGERPCSLDFQLAIAATDRGFLHVDKLSEMYWSKEQRDQKYRRV